MTTRTKTVEAPATTREVEIGRDCDRCGADIPRAHGGNPFVRFEAIVRVTVRTDYPECGAEEGWEVPDLCEKCSRWLQGVLLDGGCTIHEVDEDW